MMVLSESWLLTMISNIGWYGMTPKYFARLYTQVIINNKVITNHQ